MDRIIVTGASGFIGRYTLAPLVNLGLEVHAVCRSRSPYPVEKVAWHNCDLLDVAAGKALIAAIHPSHLLHLAWYAVPGKYWTAVENISWVEASLELVTAFIAAGGKRLILGGTAAQYDWSHGCCNEESTPCLPSTIYGASKHGLEVVCRAQANSANISHASARLFSVFGPGEPSERLIPSIIRALVRGEKAKCPQGKEKRDFLYVEDMARALAMLASSTINGPVNVGSGSAVELREIFDLCGKVTGRTDLLDMGALPSTQSDVPLLCADAKKLREQVGWDEKIGIEEGLRRTAEWWKKELKAEKLQEEER